MACFLLMESMMDCLSDGHEAARGLMGHIPAKIRYSCWDPLLCFEHACWRPPIGMTGLLRLLQARKPRGLAHEHDPARKV